MFAWKEILITQSFQAMTSPYFAPQLKDWKKRIQIKGTVKGTVDNLNAKDIIIQAGKDTYLRGNVSMAGLPDINKTYIDFEAENFRTTYNDAVDPCSAIEGCWDGYQRT